MPADGFYEWRRRRGGPEPYWVSLPGTALFAFAGIAERFGAGGDSLESVAILTCPARGRLRALHARMPVLISPADYDASLDAERNDPEAARAPCGSLLSDSLGFRPVAPRVNDIRLDDPACLAPSAQRSFF